MYGTKDAIMFPSVSFDCDNGVPRDQITRSTAALSIRSAIDCSKMMRRLCYVYARPKTDSQNIAKYLPDLRFHAANDGGVVAGSVVTQRKPVISNEID